jgi:hypothetical protein
MKSWELIFRQSRVNNGIYDGDRCPVRIGNGRRAPGCKRACAICVTAEADSPAN